MNELATDVQLSEEIIRLALTTEDEEIMWDCIGILRDRGGETEFQLASQLIASETVNERCLGARILSQLGYSKPTYVTESVDILLPMLGDQNRSILSAVIYALGHRQDKRAIVPLTKFIDHPEAEIRHGVACALGGFDDDDAIVALIRLSADTNNDVRNWATFGLGSLTEIDTPEIRSALFARTSEEDGEIRGEALVGLANRNDVRILDLVRAELNRDYAGSWVLEASEMVGDASLIPLLATLRENWGDENEKCFGDELNRALAACESKLN